MIRLHNIERSYPLGRGQMFYVLRDIDLDIAAGDFVSVMGPSGAGKSTLLHILGMHDHGWTGEFFFDETAVHLLKAKERATLRNEQVGFVFQQYRIGITVRANGLLWWRTRSIVFKSSAKRIYIRGNFPAASNNSSG